jgi:prepilin-type N-terminal cleavage/methylation domain-containing protein
VTPRRSNAAFTLIEVLLVMAVIAVLAGVVAYSLPRMTPDLLDESAARLASACERARDEAVRGGYVVRLVLDPQTGEWFLLAESDPLDRPGEFLDLPGDGSRVRKLPDEIKFGRVDVAAARPDAPALGGRGSTFVEFAADGTSDSAVIELLPTDDGGNFGSRWVLLKPAPAKAVVVDEAPDRPSLPADDLADTGESNPDGLDLESLLTFRAGLGGNNENSNPTNALQSLTDAVAADADAPPAGAGTIIEPTVP